MASVIYENNRDIVGSWYPSSYHGHFRNRPRSEYSIPFRQRAKPSPPQKFLNQTKQRTNQHPFSQHDNRHSLTNEGNLEAYFCMGLGKRKQLNSQANKSTRGILSWSNCSEPLVSTYRSQFSNDPKHLRESYNNTEPLHLKGRVGTERRQLQVRSTVQARAQTAPLLAWNTTDDFVNVKPLVGTRSNCYANYISSMKSAHPASNHKPANQIVIQETITPLNNTV